MSIETLLLILVLLVIKPLIIPLISLLTLYLVVSTVYALLDRSDDLPQEEILWHAKNREGMRTMRQRGGNQGIDHTALVRHILESLSNEVSMSSTIGFETRIRFDQAVIHQRVTVRDGKVFGSTKPQVVSSSLAKIAVHRSMQQPNGIKAPTTKLNVNNSA
ncbi:hypothetical protein MMC28_001441 [Mycoblastus sanguinarius]|nr:hypothetical protein [Mycoblastus sanguinarius]